MFEHILSAAGLGPVAGADEAGRGACAGPLVAAAVILSDDPARRIRGLADSKALRPAVRDDMFRTIRLQAVATAWAVVQAGECDLLGLQAANLAVLRQAVLELPVRPGFVITDGFAVDGLGAPGLGMWKADQVVETVSAASIVAKVIRDRIMDEVDEVWPGYGFARHKGYATAAHQARLAELGPCPQHRMSYGNVARATKVVSS